jgi:cell division septation protein DedD
MILFSTLTLGVSSMPGYRTKPFLRGCLPWLLAAAVWRCAAADPAAEGRAFLCKGDIQGARAVLHKAHADDPADPELSMLYGRTLDNADTALQIYKKIARDKSVHHSIRAESYFLLGSAAYVRGLNRKAAGYFAVAKDVSGDSRYAPQRYLSAIHDTADTAFVASLEKAAADTVSEAGAVAGYYLGIFYYVKKDFGRALDRFNTAAALPDTGAWSCPANAAAYACASAMSRPQEASAILTHIKRAWSEYLEQTMVVKSKPRLQTAKKDSAPPRDTVAWLPSDTAAGASPSAAKKDQSAQKPAFSLQVGAFGNKDNAQARTSELLAQFPFVSIAQGSAGGKPLFRVHVGSFDTREKAQTFGDTALSKKGIKFRVVEE